MRLDAANERITGTAVPLGALRTKNSCGVGEFPDLVDAGRWCQTCGIRLLQILPVNDSGFQSSPYSALSAFALHPLYIRLQDIPGSQDFDADIKKIAKTYNKLPRFDYSGVLRAKLAVLRKIFISKLPQIKEELKKGGALDAWRTAHPWVLEYAVYCALKTKNKDHHWKEWKEHSNISAKDITAFWKDDTVSEELWFSLWLQRELDNQFSAAAEQLRAMGIILKGDIPILMNEDSCDVWAHPEYFDTSLSAGAPPDMFSPLGQNWQFPVYNWEHLEADKLSWWKQRLAEAERYYDAFRIDHVLGFFRIWAASRRDRSAILGRFVPSLAIPRTRLLQLGYNDARLRWLSQPHIKTDQLVQSLERSISDEQERHSCMDAVCSKILDRIGSEELWLFKDSIRGELDMEQAGIPQAAVAFLQSAWRNRAFIELDGDEYYPTWSYWDTNSFQTLSDEERRSLDALVRQCRDESESIWEEQGRRLLAALTASTKMLPCAEDLGAVPACVPKVLEELGVLALRVVRWNRNWDEHSQPFVPGEKYPLLSVCTPAVHDSSTVRDWWENEAEQELFAAFIGADSLDESYTPATAKQILGFASSTNSAVSVFQIQDLMHLSSNWYAQKAQDERINIPGTVSDFNWTWRLPGTLEEIQKDETLVAAICEIAQRRKEV